MSRVVFEKIKEQYKQKTSKQLERGVIGNAKILHPMILNVAKEHGISGNSISAVLRNMNKEHASSFFETVGRNARNMLKINSRLSDEKLGRAIVNHMHTMESHLHQRSGLVLANSLDSVSLVREVTDKVMANHSSNPFEFYHKYNTNKAFKGQVHSEIKKVIASDSKYSVLANFDPSQIIAADTAIRTGLMSPKDKIRYGMPVVLKHGTIELGKRTGPSALGSGAGVISAIASPLLRQLGLDEVVNHVKLVSVNSKEATKDITNKAKNTVNFENKNAS